MPSTIKGVLLCVRMECIRQRQDLQKGNEEVPKPVSRGGNAHGCRAVAGRVQLSNNSPGERSPGRGEAGNKETRKGNKNAAHGRGIPRVIAQGEVADESIYTNKSV